MKNRSCCPKCNSQSDSQNESSIEGQLRECHEYAEKQGWIKPKERYAEMSKYDPLWKHIQADGRDEFKLTYAEIAAVLGFEIDHSFLTYKKEAAQYGYRVGKISMKEKTIAFEKLEDNHKKMV